MIPGSLIRNLEHRAYSSTLAIPIVPEARNIEERKARVNVISKIKPLVFLSSNTISGWNGFTDNIVAQDLEIHTNGFVYSAQFHYGTIGWLEFSICQ